MLLRHKRISQSRYYSEILVHGSRFRDRFERLGGGQPVRSLPSPPPSLLLYIFLETDEKGPLLAGFSRRTPLDLSLRSRIGAFSAARLQSQNSRSWRRPG
jgi:hypothetical protein